MSLDIAYAIRKKNAPKYAKGGRIPDEKLAEAPEASESETTEELPEAVSAPKMSAKMLASGGIVKGIMAKRMRKGGEVESIEEDDFSLEEKEPSFDEMFSEPEEEIPQHDKIKARLAKILSR